MLRCLFCDYKGELQGLCDHSAVCPSHPMQAEIKALRQRRDELTEKQTAAELSAASRGTHSAVLEIQLAAEKARAEKAGQRSGFFEKEAMEWGHSNAALVVKRDALAAHCERLREHAGLLVHGVKVAISTEFGNTEDVDLPITIRLMEGTMEVTDAVFRDTPAQSLEAIQRAAKVEGLREAADRIVDDTRNYEYVDNRVAETWLREEADRLEAGAK